MKYKTSLFMLLSLFFILLLNGCSAEKPPVKPDTVTPPEESLSSFLPLKVGNNWVYEGIGNEYAAYTQEVLYQKDNTYQVMVNNGGTVAANRYEVKEDSIKVTYREGENYDNKNILGKPANTDGTVLKQPLKIGNSWVSEGNTYEIIQKDASVEVPAGTFTDCLVIKVVYKEGDDESYYYYKEGIGLIKSEFKMPGEASIISQLKKYTVSF